MKVRFLEVWRQSNVVKGVLILEGLLLLVLLANCFRARCDRAYGCGDLYMDSDVVQVAVSEDGTEYYLADLDDNITETTILHTDYFSLWPGAYPAIIDYTSQVNYEEESNYQNGNGYFYLTTVDDSIYTRFDTLFLRNGTTSLEQTIRVTSPWKLSGLQMSVSYYGLGELAVSSLEVREIPAFRYLLFFTAILLFVIFDLVAYVLLLDRNFHYEKEVGILTLVCLAAILPFIADYAYAGHDIDFHLQRILFLAEELRNGNYFPAILSQALNGYGYAVPLHYGQIFLYIPAFLYNCGVSLRVAYNIYICLLSIATCLVMYYCALKIFKKTSTALLASALYTLSAVRLSNIFTRAALGEFTAQTFYPLIFLGFYNIYTAPKNEKITIRKYWPIIVGLTGVVVSHLLSIVMCTMLILAFVLILIKKTLEPQRFFALLKAAALTIAVSLAQLIPMATSMGTDENVFYTVNYIQDYGAYLIQIFNSVVNNYQASMDDSGYALREMSYSIGFSLTLGLILFVVWRIRLKKAEAQEKDKSGFATLCWCAALVTIFLSTKAFSTITLIFCRRVFILC
ncbi:MAG: hypothetical protein LUG61_06250 [Lachnospiraceae bacterium]|nr:hypothetical protein [Lachnospiraceae bacterium]